MICIARIFGAAVTESGGNVAASSVTGRDVRPEPADDLADAVVHGRVRLDRPPGRHAHGTESADSAEIVAHEIDDHVQFRRVLGRVAQFAPIDGAGRVPLIGRVTTPPSRSTLKNNSGLIETIVRPSGPSM